ncbi:MAG: DUF6261 family protein [Tannerella sp.]|jgi:hypothetical protein|nr:DUF6261 family protein [Tannerella sp.]
MKIKIERVRYTALRNDEFPVIYEQTLNICEKHDMKQLHLDKSYGELLTFRPSIEQMTVYLRKNSKLAAAGKVEYERDRLISVLNKVVKGFETADLPETHPHYEVLDALLSKYQSRTIASVSRAAETERLQMLETEVNGNQAVQVAFAAFGLTPVVSRLFAANHEYETLFREYIAGLSEAQRIDITALRKDCSKALSQFFDALQYSAYLYEELDYAPLINELEQLNRYYNRNLKARATRRKNGKKTDEEPSIPPMGESDSAV